MTKFRVQNYKKVGDTDWVTCGDILTLVGKNESGKSSIFRGLSKLNPSDGEKYDGLKEFPRRRYTAEFKQQDWPVSSVEFELGKAEKDELVKIAPILKDVTYVTCTRHYSWALKVDFLPAVKLSDTSNRAYLERLNNWRDVIEQAVAPEGKGDLLAPIKTNLLTSLSAKTEQTRNLPLDGETNPQSVAEIASAILAQMNEPWQKAVFDSLISDVNAFRGDLESKSKLQPAKDWVAKNIPRFIYFDRYDVIDSAVHVPSFIQQLAQTPSAPRVRATRCLFQHVGLDLPTLQQLDPTQPNKAIEELKRYADQRAIFMSSASAAMTQRFSEWWEQRKHKFRYGIDGPFFRVWVSDDLDPSEIELDQRSAGMQYFFSFYLEEAKGAHGNSILLLDEAGLQLHGTAQQKIVKFLEKLSKENQLLYTTHSPFMVNGDHLERVRVVYEDPVDGTAKVSEDVWPRDKDSLFPLQAALGYSIAQTLFYSGHQLVVEGITDYWILKAMNDVLSMKGMNTLGNDIAIVPAGGVNNLMPLAAMLLGNKVQVRVLLDGDEPGVRKGKELQSKLLLECFFVSSYTKKSGTEIEDLFPEEFYLSAVRKAYPTVKLEFSQEENQIQAITKRIEAVFGRLGIGVFEKWRPAQVLTEWIQNKPETLPTATLATFEAIFKDVNNSLKS
jgi:AAA ATPase domain/Overcoming lysogenization defect protein-like, TOPRIM domain